MGQVPWTGAGLVLANTSGWDSGSRRSRVEVGVCDRLIAVRARSSGSHPTAEQVALLAPADTEVTLLTRRARIDGAVGPGPGFGGGALACRPRQCACLQASEQYRRRPDLTKGPPHQAQVVTAVS